MKTKHRLWQLTAFSILMVLCAPLAAQETNHADGAALPTATNMTRGGSDTQTLTLKSGWNWVGFNVLPTSRTVGDVLGTTGFTVNDIVQTNGSTARFTGTSWTPANFTIEYGKLYQIYVANDVEVVVNGLADGPSSLPLVAGWNWIANSTLENAALSQLTHSGGWTENDRIQTEGGSSVVYINGKWLPSGFTLEPGKGYQIFAANAGTLTLTTENENNALYAVVDLSGGPDAASYPVRYTNELPNLDDDTCRTMELWLRRIPKGTFMMGSPEDELGRSSDEKQHKVTLTEDYYIGVFECTQKQFELVMGGNPSSRQGDCRPVENVTYSNLRGTGAQAGAGWPAYGHTVDASSFMGILQAKTGLTFDLPTEAQWEYACRAGTTTALNSGKNLTWVATDAAMDEVGRYRGNVSDSIVGGYTLITTVGSYLPNAWGLYDMHGNVWEWCLDWYANYGTTAIVDPVGPNVSTNDRRVVRGGYWNADASGCRSAKREYWLPLQSSSHGFRVAMYPKQDLYVVVDLSGGPDATNYPVRYTGAAPNLDDDTCRTTELWLRKIPAGTFTMGSPEDEVGRVNDGDMAQHQVTLTQDYYIGVFECTQKQWELVMGSNPSNKKGDCRPVEQVSYNMIRGSEEKAGAGWPTYGHAVDASSFMGKLQAKTGLAFDLPTEAQRQYACRAGTTSTLYSGKNLTNSVNDPMTSELGRYRYNQSDGKGGYTSGHTKVGSYLPNAWGLYDMYGNVDEWCLDWWGASITSTAAETDPVGPSTGSSRVVCCGGWDGYSYDCRSASRGNCTPSGYNIYFGFRIAYYPKQDLYAVVDLSSGADAESYPVRYTDTPPNLDDNTCRTTELWLRKIPAGTFMMGSPAGELGRNNDYDMAQHEVTLTQDYYIGVFECTQRQWRLVMGSNPSTHKSEVYPVEMVSYDIIRGTGTQAGAGWPSYGHAVDATSFIGKLQAKTGLTFDLPTEAQWEYACRAGTTTALNSGKNLTSTGQDANMDEVGRYYYNQSDGIGGLSVAHTKVGSYLPNVWGLYDMHGNVSEWCLDWRGTNTSSTAAATDPVGLTTSTSDFGRALRGGNYSSYAERCRSASLSSFNPWSSGSIIGFRIVCLP